MKKIVASVGLVALGASSLQPSASGQSLLGPDASKPWSIAATVRGFYDDNIATIPNDETIPPGEHRDVFGFEISPSATLRLDLQQTTIDLGTLYSFKDYNHTPIGSSGHTDQTFTFNADVNHSFNDQLKAHVGDGFVIGQEPDILRAGNAFSTFQRISGDNIRNFGSISLDDQLTPKFGLSLGYDNAFYDYSASGPTLTPSGYIYPPASGFFPGVIPEVQASPAGVLNRIENHVHLEGVYTFTPETKGLLGYSFTDVDFTKDEYIGGFLANPAAGITAANLVNPVKSDNRNYNEHVGYVGAQHTFCPELTGTIRAGASYTDYYNDPTQSASVTPYVAGDLKYTYAPESYLDVGISYDRNATDVVGLLGSGSYTVDSQAAVLFATVNHRITPQLFVNFTGQFQNNIYNGGAYNDKTEQYYLMGLNFEYRFNRYFSGDVGYEYDNLQSQLGRTYDRNRVYIGITASY
jgi:Putative beta-barrel porin 2